MIEWNRIVQGDCIEILNGTEPDQADLIFADPPFNIGYRYDVYEDRKAYGEYSDWTRRWMAACRRVLKPAGSFWVAIGDEYAAEVRVIGRKLDFHLRNWVIWHYTFGQCTQRKFARAHAHIFYWTKDAKAFTFNDMEVRVPSARQTTYNDSRADPKGRVPDDVWRFSRLCGTFSERVDWHPCQMPERLLEQIVRVSSNVGDLVLDPFSGSGTTCAVAARLGRRYLGIDISAEYVRLGNERIADTLAGRRAPTEISDDPEALRGSRAVGPAKRRASGQGPTLFSDSSAAGGRA